MYITRSVRGLLNQQNNHTSSGFDCQVGAVWL
jgi:hypothetical protein